ncbi:MAG: Gx transporter family protein, partial [Lachnospiraceae bacterium]|nr:Gx transporter family protein [Lachnospiraceae bacterium]
MIKKVPFYGFFLALALILAFIESLIPIPFGVPGMKLGLSNLMVVILIYIWSPKEALLLNLCRILLSGFMFGNAFAILYSLGGAALSFLAMWLVFRSGRYTIATMSILGGLFHNIGQ